MPLIGNMGIMGSYKGIKFRYILKHVYILHTKKALQKIKKRKGTSEIETAI